MDHASSKILKEATTTWLVVIFLASLFFQLHLKGYFSSDILFLATAVLLLYVPVGIYLKKKERITFIDSGISDFARSIQWFLILSLLVFPVAFGVNHIYQAWMGRGYHAHALQVVSWNEILVSRLLMALPEEFFFRGYVQGRLNRVFGKPMHLLGVSLGHSLWITSLIFAFSHSIIHVQWWHFLIFFPSLLFGWLFEKRGTITAPILFHAACNIFSDWVNLHYYR